MQAINELRKRKWFQYHLLTAIMMSLVAGGLMAANARSRFTITDDAQYQLWGWPMTMFQRSFEYLPESHPKGELEEALHWKDRNFYVDGIGVIYPAYNGKIRLAGIIANIFALGIGIVLCGFICEYFLRVLCSRR